jgi:hypothetical protein
MPKDKEGSDCVNRQIVWISPSGREVGFCEACYGRQSFAGLQPEEIAALHYSFGQCDPEDPRETIRKKIGRLLIAVEMLPCGEVYCAVAHAYSLLGKMAPAREWATKAVSWPRNYPGKQIAQQILRKK